MHYFAWVNLKGACISLGIGLAVYLFFIRRVLMRKDFGTMEYVNLWPQWFDMEDRLYRPAIFGLISLGGKFAQIGNEQKLENYIYWPAVRGASRAGGALAKLLSEDTLETKLYWPLLRTLSLFGAVTAKLFGDVSDMIALLFTKTFLAMRKYTEKVHVGNVITETVGHTADSFAEVLNKTIFAGHPKAHHYTGLLAGIWDGILDASRRMTHTMSYGLLLFGLGLCATIIYLLMYGM